MSDAATHAPGRQYGQAGGLSYLQAHGGTTGTPAPVGSLQVPVGKPTIGTAELSRFTIGLAAFFGAFVMREPAPYELFMVVIIPLFLLSGLKISRLAIALTTLWLLFNIGGLLSMFTMADYKGIPLYLAVTLFLGLSSVFWCAVIEADMGRLRTIMRGYVLGATITALFGIAGYFNAFPGASMFTLYDRAMGVFQDPNVFGPFLVLPTIYLVYGLLFRSLSIAPIRAVLLMILLFGIFLSFSRAAWGLVVFSGGLLYFFSLITQTDPAVRLRLILMGFAGLAAVALALLVALQFEAVYEMFEVRAKVVQEYDGAEVGRFARHWIGFAWALENPLGIGPLEFGLTLGEDTHNIWVKSLMAYGWLGFFSYLTITVITLVAGGRLIGRTRPWQPYLHCAYAAYVGHLLVGWVIDLDHWRHVFLITGIIWGCIGLELRHGQRYRRAQSEQTV
ncbi:MAG: O-antigen ligase family protein [Pseudomonadota bacterium]